MRRIVALVLAALVVAGCGSTHTKTVTQITTRTPASAFTPTAFLPSKCSDQVQHPERFLIDCNGTVAVEKITWKYWGSPVAKGLGFAFENGPNTRIRHVPAEIYVSNLHRCGSRPQYTYAVVEMTDIGAKANVTGAYTVACAGSGSVQRTEPRYDEPTNGSEITGGFTITG